MRPAAQHNNGESEAHQSISDGFHSITPTNNQGELH
jgi:hypothetical protein